MTLKEAAAERIATYEKMDPDELVLAAAKYGTAKKVAEDWEKEVRDVLVKKLLLLGFEVGQAYVRDDGIGATIQVRAGSKVISVPKLILAGVSQETINEATEEGEDSAPFVVVRMPPKKGEKAKEDTD